MKRIILLIIIFVIAFTFMFGYDISAGRVKVISDGNKHSAFVQWIHGFTPISSRGAFAISAEYVADILSGIP